jgi:hypothetical protein
MISLYAFGGFFTIQRSATLRQGNDRSRFQSAVPYLIPLQLISMARPDRNNFPPADVSQVPPNRGRKS